MKLALLALFLAGCGSGNSLVVVTVDADPPIANIAVLHTTATAAGQTSMHDFTNPPSSLGGGATTTFGIEVPSSITGPFMIHVEADDPNGSFLASGDATTTLSDGTRVDLTVTLGGGGGDMGVDMGMDMNKSVDMSSPDGGHVCVVGTDTFGNGCVLAP